MPFTYSTFTWKSCQVLWKVSEHSGIFPDTLECFKTFWKVCRHSKKISDALESLAKLLKGIRTVWNFSKYFKICLDLDFLDCLWTFQCAWKRFLIVGQLSRVFGKYPECLEISQTIWRGLRVSKDFPEFSKEISNMSTMSAIMSGTSSDPDASLGLTYRTKFV